MRFHLGAFVGAPPEGESTMEGLYIMSSYLKHYFVLMNFVIEGFYIITIASPMKCE